MRHHIIILCAAILLAACTIDMPFVPGIGHLAVQGI
jgi:hypothetical protein